MKQMMEAMKDLDIEKLMQNIPPEMAQMMQGMYQGGQNQWLIIHYKFYFFTGASQGLS